MGGSTIVLISLNITALHDGRSTWLTLGIYRCAHVASRYLLGSKFENGPDDYLLVYYRGNNDAWDGYGGGTLYTRAATVPEAIVPEVKAELEAAGLDWNKWIITDNTCGPEPKVGTC